MQKLFWRLAPVGGLILMLASCESGDKTIWLGESDNGRTITVAVGEELKVKLWGNPTTGYSWNAAALSANALVATGADYEPESETPGVGGYYCFGYQAAAAGSAGLRLMYYRVFEPSEPVAQTFQVTIVVQP